MKTKMTRKVVLMCSVVFLGISVCISSWLFLREHKTRNFRTNTELIAERRNTWQTKKNTDENHRDEHITLEESAERVVQVAKTNRMAMLNEEELSSPAMQKWLDLYDSPELYEFVKDRLENGSNYRKWQDLLESQGIPVDRGEFAAIFRKVFPTGEPEDYEPEMRLEIAKLFLAAEPVDLTDPIVSHRQRSEVYSKFMGQEKRNLAWLAGRFDADLDGILRKESNPALEWVRDVQHNAASIVSSAEATGTLVTDTDTPASSWDLSSVMENPSESSDATTGESQSIFPPVPEGLVRPAISKPGADTVVAPGLTDVPKASTNLPTVGGLEASLKAQFSSERFGQAMDTLERYGPEEGLRRLRENDPEIAKQIENSRRAGVEQRRNRSRSEASDKSEKEVSQ